MATELKPTFYLRLNKTFYKPLPVIPISPIIPRLSEYFRGLKTKKRNDYVSKPRISRIENM